MNDKERLVSFNKALKDGFGKDASDFIVELKSIPDVGTVGVARTRGEKDFYLLFTQDMSDFHGSHDLQSRWLRLLDIAKFLSVELNVLVYPSQHIPIFLDSACVYKFRSFLCF
ncbi:hypothetical protein OB959_23010 [Aeromonas bestiarum]|uniref:Uncharacterized protein n=1 Tax=Aeromonas bestiarum TaxID=105751 RepID=A0AAW7IFH7_9GAMM|nr:hypothetical protein [Aeromonas bestiarum]MDM5142622.1 hypothetical protein [Aeromonas bestiarum]